MKIIIINKLIKLVVVMFLTLITSLSFAGTKLETLTATCSACHGQLGISSNNEWPSLAGQKKGYLLQQLKAFKKGTRENAMMTGILNNISDEQLDNIAQHYASLPFNKAKASIINKAGKNKRANCISCHGMQGKTVNDTWPNLAGQNKGYLLKQLKDFSSKKRKSIIMNVIANELNEQQMIDVAEYYQQIGSKY